MEKSKSGGSFCCSTPLAPFFICIIISFRPAWLARALLSFKRAQSSGNDDVDEGQQTPLDVIARHSLSNFSDVDEGQQTPLDVARGDVRKSRAMWLTKTVDITVS